MINSNRVNRLDLCLDCQKQGFQSKLRIFTTLRLESLNRWATRPLLELINLSERFEAGANHVICLLDRLKVLLLFLSSQDFLQFLKSLLVRI